MARHILRKLYRVAHTPDIIALLITYYPGVVFFENTMVRIFSRCGLN